MRVDIRSIDRIEDEGIGSILIKRGERLLADDVHILEELGNNTQDSLGYGQVGFSNDRSIALVGTMNGLLLFFCFSAGILYNQGQGIQCLLVEYSIHCIA